MKILTNYDFSKNQLLNAVIQKLATPPTSPVAGQIYYDTVANRLFYYNGSAWKGSDALDAVMDGTDIVDAINSSTATINDARLSTSVQDAITKAHNTHAISDVTGLQTALNGKVDDSQVLTNVPAGAIFTDTVTSINGKTGVIAKADIVALGIPAQDTTYGVFSTGANGLVPMTVTSNTTDFLRKDGSWATPPDTKYTLPVAGASLGGVKSGTDITVDASGNVSVNDDSHNHIISNVDGLQTALDGKSATTHNHTLDGLSNVLITANSAGEILKWSGTAWVNNTLAEAGISATHSHPYAPTSHSHAISDVTGLQTALDGKETPAGATAKATTAENNAKAYTDTQLASLLDSAPETLNTLNELAQALGDDPNFATTITNQISAKASKFTQAVGNASATSFVLTHNLNTRDVVVMIRETASPYAQVITDVEMTTVNTVTVKFAVAPASNEYTVTIIG